MRNKSVTIWVMVAVLLMAAGQGFGTVYFSDGGTHNIDYEISDDVWVDWEAPGVHTRVNWLSGAVTPGFLRGYEDSIIKISGGSVYELYACDNSQVTMSDGSIGRALWATGNSQVMMSGGSVSGHLLAHESGKITMSGGSVNSLYAYGSSQATLSGGSVSGLLFAYESGKITMSGGWVNSLSAYHSSQVTMSGGTVESPFVLSEAAILAIYGSNFAIDGTPFGFGEITSIFGGDYSNDPFRRLTGTLANGDIINNQFLIGYDAKIVLSPPFTLTIAVEPNDVGIDTVTPDVGAHDCGGWVSIKAERFVNCPDVYTFDHWEGDVNDPNSADTTVFMDSDKTITAVFVDGRQCGDECHPYPSVDVNKDCKVDLLDIAMVASSWLECTRPECD
jgi:hypothetical protein